MDGLDPFKPVTGAVAACDPTPSFSAVSVAELAKVATGPRASVLRYDHTDPLEQRVVSPFSGMPGELRPWLRASPHRLGHQVVGQTQQVVLNGVIVVDRSLTTPLPQLAQPVAGNVSHHGGRLGRGHRNEQGLLPIAP